MAVTSFWYAKAFIAAFNKEIDIDTDTLKAALHTSTYVPDQDAHDYWNDATNEASGTGYTTGGSTLGSKTSTTTTNVWTFDAANTTWTITDTLTARYSVQYEATGNTQTSALMTWQNFGTDETASGGGTFDILWNASGIATISAADA